MSFDNYSASTGRILPWIINRKKKKQSLFFSPLQSILFSCLNFNNWLNHSFLICNRSWPCLRGLPRSHCTDACQHLVGHLVLFYAPNSWFGQPGKFGYYKCIQSTLFKLRPTPSGPASAYRLREVSGL